MVGRTHTNSGEASAEGPARDSSDLSLSELRTPQFELPHNAVPFRTAIQSLGCSASYLLRHKERFGIQGEGHRHWILEEDLEKLKGRFPSAPDLDLYYTQQETLDALDREDKGSIPPSLRLRSIKCGTRRYYEREAVDQFVERRDAPNPQLVQDFANLLGLDRSSIEFHLTTGKLSLISENPRRLHPDKAIKFALERGIQPEKGAKAIDLCTYIFDELVYHGAFKHFRALQHFWEKELKRIEPIVTGETHFTAEQARELLGYKTIKSMRRQFSMPGAVEIYGHWFFEKSEIEKQIAARELAQRTPDPLTIKGLASLLEVNWRTIQHYYEKGIISHTKIGPRQVLLNTESVLLFVLQIDSGERVLLGQPQHPVRKEYLPIVIAALAFHHPSPEQAALEAFLEDYVGALRNTNNARATEREWRVNFNTTFNSLSTYTLQVLLSNLKQTVHDLRKAPPHSSGGRQKNEALLKILLLEGE